MGCVQAQPNSVSYGKCGQHKQIYHHNSHQYHILQRQHNAHPCRAHLLGTHCQNRSYHAHLRTQERKNHRSHVCSHIRLFPRKYNPRHTLCCWNRNHLSQRKCYENKYHLHIQYRYNRKRHFLSQNHKRMIHPYKCNLLGNPNYKSIPGDQNPKHMSHPYRRIDYLGTPNHKNIHRHCHCRPQRPPQIPK